MSPELMSDTTINLIVGSLAIVIGLGAFLMMFTTIFTTKK